MQLLQRIKKLSIKTRKPLSALASAAIRGTHKALVRAMSRSQKLLAPLLRKLSRTRMARRLIKISTTLHHHLAKRPHTYLLSRVEWYASWHAWPYHGHVHRITAALFMVVMVGGIITTFQRANALSDLFDTWNFSSGSDYTLDAGAEISGTSARLKAQNYTSDANTQALYHLDEASGSSASDASPYNNTATITGGSFVTGNLNNGLNLTGTNSGLVATDSASLSLQQEHSLEAWTKLGSSFTAGAQSKQPIIDKGEYQLYYDNETGKVTYELADASATNWSMAGGNDTNGSWDANGKRSVNAMTKMGSDIYAAIGIDTGDAEVWRLRSGIWSLIGGGPNAINGSWPALTYEGVYALASDGTNIYAGFGTTAGDGDVWRWNGSSWTKIGGDGVSGSWAAATYEQVWALTYYGSNLYAALGTSANDAEVWRWNGSSWTKIGGDSLNSGWTTNYEVVASLTTDGTNLYAGLGASTTDAEVWRWNGTSWALIGGDGVNGSWNTNYETVRSLTYMGSQLYAGIGDTAADAEVWSYNGTTWTQIGGDGLSGSWTTNYEYVGALSNDGTNVYAGLANSDGDGEVYRWNGSTWTKIGGDAVNGSWATAVGDAVNTLLSDGSTLYTGLLDAGGTGTVYSWNGTTWTWQAGNYVNESWGFFNLASIRVSQVVGDSLYVGFGDAAGSAVVWRWDGTTWTMIGGQGVRGSWAPNTIEQVLSMTSYNGRLYVGLGNSANDADVWMYNGSSWTQIGGDSLNSGWTTNYEEVYSLTSVGGFMYAGIGNSANDAEVWRWNESSWTKIGGDSLNSGWTTNYERVSSLASFNGRLIAGLGASTNDAEIWEWNGSAWSKIGGDGLNSSWNTSYEQVETMAVFNGKFYAGLGNSTDDAEIWEWNGSAWSKIGGDDVSSSWASGTFERVKSLATYNGDLYASLGTSTGDGEVWRYRDASWTKVGGTSINGSWSNVIEEVETLSVFKGKLYAGTGINGNADALVYSLGDNGYLQSITSSFNTDWRHLAVTYDGTTMKLFIDGTLNSSKAVNLSLPDTTHQLRIGSTFGSYGPGTTSQHFQGQLDEVRISNTARSSFTTKPFSTSSQRVTLANAIRKSGVWHWDEFTPTETLNGGSIQYRLSADAGTTWQYWNGTAWATSSGNTDSNPGSVIDANIATFPVTFDGLLWQAILTGDGTQRVTLNDVNLAATSDTIDPSANATAVTAQRANGGASLAANAWTNGNSPYFSWTGGSDDESGIKGYCAYLGPDNTADPVATKGLLGTSPNTTGGHCPFVITTNNLDVGISGYIGTALTTSTSPYYLRLKAIDNAANITTATEQFNFRFDNTAPSNPGFVTAPSGFINTKDVMLTWPTTGANAPSDDHAGLAGLQYRIGPSGTWYGDLHTGTGDISDLLTNDGAYQTVPTPDHTDLQEGINTIYFRTWDAAGNVTATYTTAAIKLNTAGSPSEPQNVSASPSSNTTNAFAFDWDQPTTFVGDANKLTYCYTVNVVPSASNCTFTGEGITSLGSGPYATQPGNNTFYVVARDESSNINYASFSSVTFSANTPAPGIPLNIDIVDVSIKTTSNWRLALTWEPPTNIGAGVSSYKVFRSTNNTTFVFVGSSSSTTYIDAGLSQQRYYYRVQACDNTNNCGADSSVVNELPTGKYTTPAGLVADPTMSGITTKRATIQWSTDRASDSKIAIGTQSGVYGSSEVGNSSQVTAHEIELDNLSAGTTYYFIAKWTDEDGNTGQSQERTFRTSPAPTLKEIETVSVGLSSASIKFTSTNASRVRVVYGISESFGGIQTVNTAISESSYRFELGGLTDGAKYFYKLISYDSEGNTYEGSVFSFSTPARPRISNLRFQPVPGQPTSTQEVSWTTNVPSTSLVTYSKIATKPIIFQAAELVTEHTVIIRDLEDDSEYSLVAESRDKDGNLAVSDTQSFRTALDTRPPKISDVVVEASIRGTGAEARGQLVVSWKTDEPSTSQVAYSEGSSATSFNSKTSEDTALTTEHIVIVSDLPTSKVYSVRPVSRDKAQNSGEGTTESAIIGRASDSVLTVILNTLQKVFGL